MAYYYQSLGSLSPEQQSALTDLDPAEIRKLSIEKRIDLALRHAETKARKSEAFWSAIPAAIMLLAFIGIKTFGK